ncbi:Ger(x)C family spore germination protein [Paenibacillus glycinis]|uniref:Ger(X)C family spore germination protein n=1 Tax=Paenibacillus glycinis TaxID=2697035 RepID=A0ABW9XPP5_9BACL|nr:Ger(x)C family spore germination protein [Paenibacillus glycinis]NBD24619.1 Ger(x)C family spore germination protein [Paenibacillus glycinis]
MKRTACVMLTICLLGTACVKQQILDRVNLFIVASYDKIANDQIEITLAVPKFQAGKPETVTDELYSKTGRTNSGIREFMSSQMDKPLQTGKLSVVLFGSDKASGGVAKELDVLLRNAVFSHRMSLAVVDGNAKNVLERNFSKKQEKGMFIDHLLDSNTRKGALPSQNLHEFEYSLLGEGLDPYLPLLQIQHDRLVVSGTALFKNDKYVASLDFSRSKLMKLLLQDMNQGIFDVRLDSGAFVAIENVGSSVKYRMKNDAVAIGLSMNGKIREADGYRISDKDLRNLNKRFERQLVQAESELVKTFQKHGVDPLGLGDFARSRNKNWNEADWMRNYPTMDVSLDVDVNIKETGTRL